LHDERSRSNGGGEIQCGVVAALTVSITPLLSGSLVLWISSIASFY
jgi:hypothetical protein